MEQNVLKRVAITTHGLAHTPEYRAWASIKQRCYNEKNEFYHRYGSRGITMCDEWKDNFETFYKDMGPRPSDKHSIDREKNDCGYSKDNCKWSTVTEQNNNRSNNTLYTHNGEINTLSEWCEKLKINYFTIYMRIQRGISFKEAIETPMKEQALSLIEYRGELKTLAEWCRLLDLKYKSIYTRIKKGWSFEEAIQNIQDRLITFNPCNDDKPSEVMPLSDWCDLLRLNKNATYLRILKGESFETIVREY